MILAAGLGKRMRPLTDTTPKPLLQVAGKPLIEYHIENLRAAGVTDLVINLAYLGEKIRDYLGTGERFGVSIDYSDEGEPLETAGAILKASALLGDEPFLLVNGDVWADFDFACLANTVLPAQSLGRLIMVANPEHNPDGDFALGETGRLHLRQPGEQGYTFSGISLLRAQLVTEHPEQRDHFPLVECFRHAIGNGALEGEVHQGEWWDIGTPERLQALDNFLAS